MIRPKICRHKVGNEGTANKLSRFTKIQFNFSPETNQLFVTSFELNPRHTNWEIKLTKWAISEADNVIDDRGGCGGHSPNNLRRPTQFSLSLSLLWFLLHYVMLLLVSVTSLGENSRLWQNFKSIWPLLSRLFSIRQNIDLTLAICKLLGRFSLL